HRIDLRENPVAMMRLRAVAEHTKIELSRRSRAMVKIEEVAFGLNGKPIDLEAKLTRDELVSSIGDLVDRTFASCKEAMILAGVGQDRIADVVLVGGVTRIPFVRTRVAQFFGREARSDMNPEDAIATGAALQAASIEVMLARAPQRPMNSVVIPVDDLSDALAPGVPVEVEAELSPSRIGEVKRPKRGTDMFSGQPRESEANKPRRRRPSDADPAKAAARAKEFFGDLFGDKAVPAATPAVRKSGVAPRVQGPPKPTPAVAPRVQVLPKPVPKKPAPAVETSMPFIELEPMEDDLDEISGELLIDVEPESDSIFVEVEPPEPAPQIEIEAPDEPQLAPAPRAAALELDWDPPQTLDVDASGSQRILFEDALDEPTRAEPSQSMEIDLVMPAPTKRTVSELDWEPPLARMPLAQMPLAQMPVAPMPVARAATESIGRMEPGRVTPAVVDVTPRSLGIGTVAGFCEELIRRNSQLPASVRKLFATSRDGQDSVRIVICQGESRRIENNILIGELSLVNLPRRARGETQIEVEFRLDASGILHVSARDVATGTEQRARLDLLGGMAPEDMTAAAHRLKQLSSIKARD
ncbi:MAG: Hsp70 family protein, partial [Deltaproteobacteria bacterium]|nr:Hsp70 family protein [Deltaproteobacteria bacterium]